MTITTEAAQVYRDKQGSALWNPRKSEIRTLFANVDAQKLSVSGENIDPASFAINVEYPDRVNNSIADWYGNIGYGGGWNSQNVWAMKSISPHLSSVANTIFIMETTGGGMNGPGNADYAAQFLSFKTDWQFSLVPGELDAQYVNAAQGLSSDAGGVLNSVQKVFQHGHATNSHTGNGVTTVFNTNFVIPTDLTIEPVAVYITEPEGSPGRVYPSAGTWLLTRDAGTGFGIITFADAPETGTIVRLYETCKHISLTADGTETEFTTDFDCPLDTNAIVYVDNVRQYTGFSFSQEELPFPESLVTPRPVTVIFDVAPTVGKIVRLELGSDGGITSNEFGAVAKITMGIGSDYQITQTFKAVQGVLGMCEGYDGKQENIFGSFMEARVGECFAAYHAGALNTAGGTAGTPPYWRHLLFFESARPQAPTDREENQVFSLSGDGKKIRMGPPDDRKIIDVDEMLLRFRNAADSFNLATLNEDGNFEVANRLISPGGLVLKGSGSEKKVLRCVSNDMEVRNAAETITLVKVSDIGAMDVLDRVAAPFLLLTPQTVAQLNTAPNLARPVGTWAYCTNGDAGNPCGAVRVGSTWKRVPFGADIAIS